MPSDQHAARMTAGLQALEIILSAAEIVARLISIHEEVRQDLNSIFWSVKEFIDIWREPPLPP
jgi:hypothetical protein